ETAAGEASEAEVVFGVPKGGFGDGGALGVGGHTFRGAQPVVHRRDRVTVIGRRTLGRVVDGGGVQVTGFADGDQPVRAGRGQVVLGAVAGVSEHDSDRLNLSRGVRSPVACDQFRCGDGLFDQVAVVLVVDWAGAHAGGHNQPIRGGDRLTVVALHPAATAHRLHPRLRVGDVSDALIGLRLGRLGGGAGGFGGPCLVKLGLGLAPPTVLL